MPYAHLFFHFLFALVGFAKSSPIKVDGASALEPLNASFDTLQVVAMGSGNPRAICAVNVGCYDITGAVELDRSSTVDANADKQELVVDMHGKMYFQIRDALGADGERKCKRHDAESDVLKEVQLWTIPVGKIAKFTVTVKPHVSATTALNFFVEVPFSYKGTVNAKGEISGWSTVWGQPKLGKFLGSFGVDFGVTISAALKTIAVVEAGVQAQLKYTLNAQLTYNNSLVHGSARSAVEAAAKAVWKVGLDSDDVKTAAKMVSMLAPTSPLTNSMRQLADLIEGSGSRDLHLCGNPDDLGWLPTFSATAASGEYTLKKGYPWEFHKSESSAHAWPQEDANKVIASEEAVFKPAGSTCAEGAQDAASGASDCMSGTCGRVGRSSHTWAWECCANGLTSDASWYCLKQTPPTAKCSSSYQCDSYWGDCAWSATSEFKTCCIDQAHGHANTYTYCHDHTADGDPCVHDVNCAHEWCNLNSKRCESYLDGQECSVSEQCRSKKCGYGPDYSATKTYTCCSAWAPTTTGSYCEARREVGERCATGKQCMSGRCSFSNECY